MIKFDIKDLYVNVPIEETIQINQTQLSKLNNKQIIQQTIILLQTILNPKLLRFPEQNIPNSERCFNMFPISNNIAEMFLQNL